MAKGSCSIPAIYTHCAKTQNMPGWHTAHVEQHGLNSRHYRYTFATQHRRPCRPSILYHPSNCTSNVHHPNYCSTGGAIPGPYHFVAGVQATPKITKPSTAECMHALLAMSAQGAGLVHGMSTSPKHSHHGFCSSQVCSGCTWQGISRSYTQQAAHTQRDTHHTSRSSAEDFRCFASPLPPAAAS
jgi:hypothetical protein